MQDLDTQLERFGGLITSILATEYDSVGDQAGAFLNQAFELGLGVARSPKRRNDPRLVAFLDRHALDFERVFIQCGAFYGELSDQLSDEWLDELTFEDVCRLYSGGRFLHELYSDTDALIDTREFSEEDDYLEELRAVIERQAPVDEVPDGIPTSHWWWWLPNDPPGS